MTFWDVIADMATAKVALETLREAEKQVESASLGIPTDYPVPPVAASWRNKGKTFHATVNALNITLNSVR